MRKILMFVGTFAVIFMLAACGNGVQKKTSEKYSAAEVEQAGQVMKYYNTSLALLKNLVLEKDVNSILGYMEQGGNAPMLELLFLRFSLRRTLHRLSIPVHILMKRPGAI